MGRRLGKGTGIGGKITASRGKGTGGKSSSLRQHWYRFALPALGAAVKAEGRKGKKYLEEQRAGIEREMKTGGDIGEVLASLGKDDRLWQLRDRHVEDKEKLQKQIILTWGICSSPWSSLSQSFKSLAGLKDSLDIYVGNKNVQCGGN